VATGVCGLGGDSPSSPQTSGAAGPPGYDQSPQGSTATRSPKSPLEKRAGVPPPEVGRPADPPAATPFPPHRPVMAAFAGEGGQAGPQRTPLGRAPPAASAAGAVGQRPRSAAGGGLGLQRCRRVGCERPQCRPPKPPTPAAFAGPSAEQRRVARPNRQTRRRSRAALFFSGGSGGSFHPTAATLPLTQGLAGELHLRRPSGRRFGAPLPSAPQPGVQGGPEMKRRGGRVPPPPAPGGRFWVRGSALGIAAGGSGSVFAAAPPVPLEAAVHQRQRRRRATVGGGGRRSAAPPRTCGGAPAPAFGADRCFGLLVTGPFSPVGPVPSPHPPPSGRRTPVDPTPPFLRVNRPPLAATEPGSLRAGRGGGTGAEPLLRRAAVPQPPQRRFPPPSVTPPGGGGNRGSFPPQGWPLVTGPFRSPGLQPGGPSAR
jgi:hypothetical protein